MSRVRKVELKSGKEAQIYLLPAGVGLKTATKLFKAFAPCLASVMASSQEEEGINFMNLSFTIVEGMDSVDVNDLVKVLLQDLAIDKFEVNFDEYFIANYGELIEIMTFALKENFSSFLELKGFVEKYLPMQAEEPKPAE